MSLSPHSTSSHLFHTFTSFRVGEGPFPTELEDDDCLKLRRIGERQRLLLLLSPSAAAVALCCCCRLLLLLLPSFLSNSTVLCTLCPTSKLRCYRPITVCSILPLIDPLPPSHHRAALEGLSPSHPLLLYSALTYPLSQQPSSQRS